MKNVAVIGAGLTGLTTAYALKKKGYAVTVLESTSKVGGVLQSVKKDGFTFETGANAIIGLTQDLVELFEELELDGEVIDAEAIAYKRFIVRNQKVHPLPRSFFDFLTTPLISLKSKLQLLKEPFIPAPSVDKEESLADFVKRRFNDEILHYGFEPFISGIYAGSSNDLSFKLAMPKLYALEKEHGSLARGMIHMIRERRRVGAPLTRPMISFREGMHTLPLMISQKLEEQIFVNTHMHSIKPVENGWQIEWSNPDQTRSDVFDSVVLAIPAHQLVRLPVGMDLHAFLAPIAEVPYAPLSVVSFGFKKSQVKHPLDGVGFLTSSQENYGCLGVLFTSSMFPNRAPKDHVTLTAFIGGSYHPKRAAMPSADLESVAYHDLEQLLGVTGSPLATHHTFWPHSIPQYNVGYDRYLSRIKDAEARWPGLFFAGNYRTGVSVVDCIEGGLDMGDRV